MGILLERLRQRYRTMAYPDGPPPELPKRWRGRPRVDLERLAALPATDFCPTGALRNGAEAGLDTGLCIFCGACAATGAVSFSRDYAQARFDHDDLFLRDRPIRDEQAWKSRAERLALIRSTFRRSFKLRQVSAGGCNACEADSNVLGTLAWDMGRFGMSFVASPRHADGILVTGPVTDAMRLALEKTYAAVPTPKVVIAVGACAVSGGLYGDRTGRGRLESLLPVDLYIPGCPPHPLTILEGLLRLIGRIDDLKEV